MKTKKMKVLIIDDEADVVEFLSYNFKRKGYETAGAVNGIDGIRQVDSFTPDLIISDIMMPEMNGIMMCDVLKGNPKHKNIPLIFLSAIQDDYGVMQAGISGDDFVSKPVKFPFLLAVVEKHLLFLR